MQCGRATSPESSDTRVELPEGYSYAGAEGIGYGELARLVRISGLEERVTAKDIRSSNRFDAEHGVSNISVGVRDEHGQLVGYGEVAYKDGAGIMCNFAVDKQHQGKGIGKAIILERLRQAEEEGVESLYMPYLEDTNTLASFYGELGFTVTDAGEVVRGPNPHDIYERINDVA